jgi:hypothetical protein
MEYKSKIDIVPYVEVDGAWTFSDSFIKSVYDRILNEGKGYMFINGVVSDRNIFLKRLKDLGSIVYFGIYEHRKLAYYVLLNGFDGRVARVEWCTFNETPLRRTVKGLKELCEYLMHKKDKEGNYLFDLLLGCYADLPSFSMVPKIARMVGGHCTKESIPNLIWDASQKKSVSGYWEYFVRS